MSSSTPLARARESEPQPVRPATPALVAVQEATVEADELRVGQRIRVNVPGVGDDGQVGTIKKILGNHYYVHLDWDERPQRVVLFYAPDLERLPDESVPAR
jgi:hypothetical protein